MERRKFSIEKNEKLYIQDGCYVWFDSLQEVAAFKKDLEEQDKRNKEQNKYEIILKIIKD